MTGLSTKGEAAVLGPLTTNAFVSLHTSDPLDTGGSEVSGGSYARQGPTACEGMAVPMDKLEEVLASVLDRRQERTERRAAHAAELRRKAAEAEARLKRLYDAIGSGVADLGDDSLKERIAELRALKAQAQADAERATIALEGIGVEITPDKLRSFAAVARQRLRGPDGGYRRDHLRALAQRVEVAGGEVRIMGSRNNLLRTLAAASGVASAGAVPSFVPRWRRERPPRGEGFLIRIGPFGEIPSSIP